MNNSNENINLDLYKSIFNHNKIAQVIFDEQNDIFTFNISAERWFQKAFKVQLSSGMDIISAFQWEETRDFQKRVDLFTSNKGESLSWMIIIGDPDQEESWFQLTLKKEVTGSEKNFNSLSIEDVTSRKKSIDKLTVSEDKFRSLVKNSSDIITIIDSDGIIQYISDSVKKILGYEPVDCSGKPAKEYLYEEDMDSFERFISNLKKHKNQTFYSEFQVKNKWGNLIHLEVSGTNQLDNPSICGFVLNGRNITDRKQVETMMGRIYRRIELILNAAGEGIFGISDEGHITFVNPYGAKLLGFKEEELIDKHFSEIIEFNHEDINPIVETLQNGDYHTSDNINLLRKNLPPLSGVYSATAIKEKKAIKGAVITFNDISEQKEFENQLKKARDRAEKADRAKSDFLAHMSHEIRTPINSIMGFLELISLTELTEPQREYINIISDSSKNLLEVINAVLDLSKIEEGKYDLNQVIFNPSREFNSTIKLFTAWARKKDITITYKIEEKCPDIIGDPLKIKQVLINLIGNAIKFTPTGGEINILIEKVEEKPAGYGLLFKISDSGIGIPEDKQSAIFEPFTQTDNYNSGQYGGTGLGLTISNKIIKLMGSEIKLKSSPEKGSEFQFTIDFQVSSREPEIEPDRITDHRDNYSYRPERDIKVLVAEDTENNQKLMRLMLKKLGVESTIAENGLVAFDSFIKNDYDIIFMDGNMPLCDGIKCTKRIRKYEQEKGLSPIPIIALTALAIEGDREEFLKSGMDHYLTKPIEISTLMNTIKEFLKINFIKDNKKESPKVSEEKSNFIADINMLSANLGLDTDMVIELLMDFGEDLDQYISNIEKAVTEEDRETIEIYSHKLKGISATYGFTELSELCNKMETHARKEEEVDYGALVKKISRKSMEVKKRLSDYSSTASEK